MRILSTLLFVIIILFGVSFALLNAEMVQFNYYIGQKTLPLSLLLVLTLTLGAFLGLLVVLRVYLRTKREIFKLRHRLKVAEKEVENIRAMPLKDNH